MARTRGARRACPNLIWERAPTLSLPLCALGVLCGPMCLLQLRKPTPRLSNTRPSQLNTTTKPTVDQRITAARIILGAANRDEAALIYARLKQLYDRITYDSVQVPSPPTLVPSDFPDGDPEPVLKLSDSAAPTFGAGQGSRAFFLPFRDGWRHDHSIQAGVMNMVGILVA